MMTLFASPIITKKQKKNSRYLAASSLTKLLKIACTLAVELRGPSMTNGAAGRDSGNGRRTEIKKRDGKNRRQFGWLLKPICRRFPVSIYFFSI